MILGFAEILTRGQLPYNYDVPQNEMGGVCR